MRPLSLNLDWLFLKSLKGLWMYVDANLYHAVIIRQIVRGSDLKKLKTQELRTVLKIFEIKDFAITDEIVLSNSAFTLRRFCKPTSSLLSSSNLGVFFLSNQTFRSYEI
jgi:hypothetical protein